jgi:hypothetical protein
MTENHGVCGSIPPLGTIPFEHWGSPCETALWFRVGGVPPAAISRAFATLIVRATLPAWYDR